MAKKHAGGPGRRKGPVTFPGKNHYTSIGFTSALKKAYELAEKRTGRSWSELVALVSLTGASIDKITLAHFENYPSAAKR